MIQCPSCRHDNPTESHFCGQCGAALAGTARAGDAAAALERQVLELLAAGRKIEAIKVYREQTGAGLKVAKDAVEALAERRPSALPVTPSGAVDREFEAELLGLLRSGQKIEAIRLYRDRTSADLKVAKESVEQIARVHGVSTAAGRSGCLGTLVPLVLAFLGLMVSLFW
jgi:ribosomal protein L7/L12